MHLQYTFLYLPSLVLLTDMLAIPSVEPVEPLPTAKWTLVLCESMKGRLF